jgi:hypothetical protein
MNWKSAVVNNLPFSFNLSPSEGVGVAHPQNIFFSKNSERIKDDAFSYSPTPDKKNIGVPSA